MNHLTTIQQHARELLTAMRGQARYRDTVPKKLVHVYALLYMLMTEDNPYRITNIFGEKYLHEECLMFVKNTIGIDDDELDQYFRYLNDVGFVELVDNNFAFDGGYYIRVNDTPFLDIDDE